MIQYSTNSKKCLKESIQKGKARPVTAPPRPGTRLQHPTRRVAKRCPVGYTPSPSSSGEPHRPAGAMTLPRRPTTLAPSARTTSARQRIRTTQSCHDAATKERISLGVATAQRTPQQPSPLPPNPRAPTALARLRAPRPLRCASRTQPSETPGSSARPPAAIPRSRSPAVAERNHQPHMPTTCVDSRAQGRAHGSRSETTAGARVGRSSGHGFPEAAGVAPSQSACAARTRRPHHSRPTLDPTRVLFPPGRSETWERLRRTPSTRFPSGAYRGCCAGPLCTIRRLRDTARNAHRGHWDRCPRWATSRLTGPGARHAHCPPGHALDCG